MWKAKAAQNQGPAGEQRRRQLCTNEAQGKLRSLLNAHLKVKWCSSQVGFMTAVENRRYHSQKLLCSFVSEIQSLFCSYVGFTVVSVGNADC